MGKTFTANADGTGILAETITFPDGSSVNTTSDFVDVYLL
jgi:hypothetical protein